MGRVSPEYVFEGRYQPIIPWQADSLGRSRVMFSHCVGGEDLHITISPFPEPIGKHAGFMTYATSHDWVGVQYRVAIADGPFLDIDSFDSGFNYTVPSGNTQVVIQVQFRYIALTGVQEAGYLDPDAIFMYSGAGGALVSASEDAVSPYEPPPLPSCSFKSFKRSIDLGRLHTSQLRNVGDKGPAHEFSWGYTCNESVSSAEVRYGADSIIDANAGLFAVTGGAKGVALEVRRGVTGSSEGVPVKFNSSYRLGTGSPTERMLVRYVRTGDVTAGDANGNLKILLDYY